MTASAFVTLDAYLASEAQRVERALERAVDRIRARGDQNGKGVPVGLPEPLVDAIRHGVLTGGKRLRPVLCATSYVACGGTASDALYDLAASLELIHAYSLMHDDLPCMDDADLRRGQPTTHRIHGEATTVRAGAALIPLAALQCARAARALGCPPDRTVSVTRVLLGAAGAGGMVGGQWLDLEGEGRALGGDELDRLHGLKTGALLTAPLVMGAIAAGAEPRIQACLTRYGRAVGLAFQIADDILDATASAETLGKNPSDTALDKSTYVAIHGLDEARRRAAAAVQSARAALDESRLDAPALDALARFVIERRS